MVSSTRSVRGIVTDHETPSAYRDPRIETFGVLESYIALLEMVIDQSTRFWRHHYRAPPPPLLCLRRQRSPSLDRAPRPTSSSSLVGRPSACQGHVCVLRIQSRPGRVRRRVVASSCAAVDLPRMHALLDPRLNLVHLPPSQGVPQTRTSTTRSQNHGHVSPACSRGRTSDREIETRAELARFAPPDRLARVWIGSRCTRCRVWSHSIAWRRRSGSTPSGTCTRSVCSFMLRSGSGETRRRTPYLAEVVSRLRATYERASSLQHRQQGLIAGRHQRRSDSPSVPGSEGQSWCERDCTSQASSRSTLSDEAEFFRRHDHADLDSPPSSTALELAGLRDLHVLVSHLPRSHTLSVFSADSVCPPA
jgi:hypothetical protein